MQHDTVKVNAVGVCLGTITMTVYETLPEVLQSFTQQQVVDMVNHQNKTDLMNRFRVHHREWKRNVDSQPKLAEGEPDDSFLTRD